MINKKNILTGLFFLTIFSYSFHVCAQITKTNSPFEFSIFDNKKGFLTYNVRSLNFDDLGWLWIAGASLDLAETKVGYRTAILQRYNGNSFYTVPLPKFKGEKPRFIKLNKRKDGQFLATISWVNEDKLFLVNPTNFNFTEIKFPSYSGYQKISIQAYKNHFLVNILEGNKAKLFRLNNDLTTTLLQNLKQNYEGDNRLFFSNFIGFDNHFIIDDSVLGLQLYKSDGAFIQKVKALDVGIKNNDSVLHITTWFEKKGRIYVQFKGENDYFNYLEKTKSWVRVKINQIVSIPNSNTFEILSDKKGNFISKEFLSNKIKFTFYGAQNTSIFIDNSSSFDTRPKVISRDFSKEFIVISKGVFYHYNFEKGKVTTFLESLSIRAIIELNKEEILVSTQSNGWYIINLKTKKTKNFHALKKGKFYKIIQAKKIFNTPDNYWSNTNFDIISINKKTLEVSTFTDRYIKSLTEDNTSIYYATDQQYLMQFNKKTKERKKLVSIKGYQIEEILKINNTIYLSSLEGLLVYKFGQLKIHKPSSKIDNGSFVSIINHKKQGVLVGTKSGKLFRFNPIKSTFELLFEDELKTVIATMLVDDDENIWLNTFNGIIKFNPTTKVSTRYSTNDGLSYSENNRFSALKTSDGHFLIGTLKGLNYFDPSDLIKNNSDTELVITSANYYNSKAKKEISKLSPQKLSALKTVVLPPENKNITLEYGLLGIYSPEKINYRYKINNLPWVYLKNATKLRLSNLSAGNYSLQINALDISNSIIGKPLFLDIYAKDFFYKTTWFYFLLTAVLFGIGFLFYVEQQKKTVLKEQFAKQIIANQELEQSRIAKELHDNIGQRLLLLKNNILQQEQRNNDEIKILEETIAEVRTMSHDLHPFQFEKLGLIKSIKNMMDAFQRSSDVFYSYSINDVSNDIPKEKHLFIFRMLQEAISNVEKHANATACNLTIINKKRKIIFTLKDNGKGFLIEKNLDTSKSLGLKSLNERARYINANFTIKSAIEKGTTITLKLDKV